MNARPLEPEEAAMFATFLIVAAEILEAVAILFAYRAVFNAHAARRLGLGGVPADGALRRRADVPVSGAFAVPALSCGAPRQRGRRGRHPGFRQA
jgi:hypothetical protein